MLISRVSSGVDRSVGSKPQSQGANVAVRFVGSEGQDDVTIKSGPATPQTTQIIERLQALLNQEQKPSKAKTILAPVKYLASIPIAATLYPVSLVYLLFETFRPHSNSMSNTIAGLSLFSSIVRPDKALRHLYSASNDRINLFIEGKHPALGVLRNVFSGDLSSLFPPRALSSISKGMGSLLFLPASEIENEHNYAHTGQVFNAHAAAFAEKDFDKVLTHYTDFIAANPKNHVLYENLAKHAELMAEAQSLARLSDIPNSGVKEKEIHYSNIGYLPPEKEEFLKALKNHVLSTSIPYADIAVKAQEKTATLEEQSKAFRSNVAYAFIQLARLHEKYGNYQKADQALAHSYKIEASYRKSENLYNYDLNPAQIDQHPSLGRWFLNKGFIYAAYGDRLATIERIYPKLVSS
jgi:tetratricopeptide (TPR) repeat protein